MQKFTYLSTLFLAIIFSSCASKALQLTLSPPEGFQERYNMVNTTNTLSQVMGMDVEALSNQVIEFEVKKIGETANGNHQLEMMYTAMAVTQSSMGTEKNYDSQNPEVNNEPNLAKLYDKMLDQPWRMTFQPNGEVTAVEGLDELFEGMYEALDDEVRVMMESQFGASTISQLFETMTSYIPQKPVKIGDKWPVSNTLDIAGMRLKVDIVYTLSARKDGVATLDIQGQVVTDPEGAGLQMGEMEMKFQLVGTQQGQMLIDEKSGWAISSRIDQELGGKMFMTGLPTGEDLEANMELATQQTLERVKP